ncbi:MAG: sigma-70 family RNA polymerase sigma factor [Christensenellaceae bacterium]|nr:sigma-70 family RNA polymerase sigma factor [Christensenellaceae bacterium]
MSNEELALVIQRGEPWQLEALLEQNRGFLHKWGLRYAGLASRNRGLDFDDLLQACRLGMLLAAQAHDPTRGPFLTIAALYMANEARRALGIRTTRKAIESMSTITSLNAPVDDESGAELQDLLLDELATDPQASAEAADMRRLVREALSGLSDGQRTVVEAKWLRGPSYAEAARLEV